MKLVKDTTEDICAGTVDGRRYIHFYTSKYFVIYVSHNEFLYVCYEQATLRQHVRTWRLNGNGDWLVE